MMNSAILHNATVRTDYRINQCPTRAYNEMSCGPTSTSFTDGGAPVNQIHPCCNQFPNKNYIRTHTKALASPDTYSFPSFFFLPKNVLFGLSLATLHVA